MQNAFDILGATPLDNSEKLQELFEEKQLLLDNDVELAEAYSSLTNPKKRINHEIEYFAKDEFEEFNEIFIENAESEQKMNLHDTCSAIINLGRWFDSDSHSIYTQINDNREISGFSKLNNSSVVSTAINELRTNCVNAVTKYFEFIDEKGLVKLFNELVEYEDFTSFFVDELMAHYEIKIAPEISKTEEICLGIVDEIEKSGKLFIEGKKSSDTLSTKIVELKKELSTWDKLVQPLQVNSQAHGAQHEGSLTLVNKIRKTIISLGNSSQDPVNEEMLEFSNNMQLFIMKKNAFDYAGYFDKSFRAQEAEDARQKALKSSKKLSVKLASIIEFQEILIKITEILIKVFAENELMADLLRRDKKDLSGIKTSFNKMLKQIDPYGTYSSKPNTTKTTGSSNSSGGSYNGGHSAGTEEIGIVRPGAGWGIAIGIFMTIGGFVNDIIGLGVFGVIIAIISTISLFGRK